jgi:hypothetical protein
VLVLVLEEEPAELEVRHLLELLRQVLQLEVLEVDSEEMASMSMVPMEWLLEELQMVSEVQAFILTVLMVLLLPVMLKLKEEAVWVVLGVMPFRKEELEIVKAD